jgi:hypothetical protein
MIESVIVSSTRDLLLVSGGAAAVVLALVSWLGGLWQKRILQQEKSMLMQHLESYRHELRLVGSSYDQYLDLILDYYNHYFKHYRLCQRACCVDAHEQPDGEITYTIDEFDAALDDFLCGWASQEGKIRILLPGNLLELHEKSIDAFNGVKRAVEGFSKDYETRQKKYEAFGVLDAVKTEVEIELRKFLRTESLLK